MSSTEARPQKDSAATPESPKEAAPQKEHLWLQRMVGEWTFEVEASMTPGEPSVKLPGTETVRSLGGLWTLAEGVGETPEGAPAKSLMTLGYDPQKKRFVGTFVASMMTHMWVYDGALDAGANKLTLDTEGPGAGKTASFQDIIEFKSKDERTMTSQMRNDDGTWTQVMTATYRRKK